MRFSRAIYLLLMAGFAWQLVLAHMAAGGEPIHATPAHRDQAEVVLSQARERVQEARGAAVSARKQLDEFLASHFDKPPLEPPAAAEPRAEAKPSEPPADPAVERLKTQYVELIVRRQELLGHLTDEHPEVIDLTSRIATLEGQIESLGGGLQSPEKRSNQARQEDAAAAGRWNEYVHRQQELRQQDAEEYQILYDHWQAAEAELDRALAAEGEAGEQLAAIEAALNPAPTAEAPPPAQPAQHEPQAAPPTPIAAQESPREVKAETAHAAPSSLGGSQALALAALLIALAVAALAAVRLARSSADPIFASAEEVAAALAIPVVGIIPASAARVANPSATKRRRFPLFAQLLLAAGMFVVVAALVSPAGLWQQCHQAMQSLRTADGVNGVE